MFFQAHSLFRNIEIACISYNNIYHVNNLDICTFKYFRESLTLPHNFNHSLPLFIKMRKNRFAALLLVISALLIVYLVKLETSYLTSSKTKANYDFSDFNNTVGSSKLIVPNLVHYIVFDRTDIDFVMFVCMLSAWLNHRPSQIMMHTNVEINAKSKYVTVLRSVMGKHFFAFYNLSRCANKLYNLHVIKLVYVNCLIHY